MLFFNKKRKNKQKKERDAHILSENSPFGIQEAYKALRTNVMFSMTGKDCKVIILTSGMQGEAKSTTSLNLALTFAQNKAKTLLIDCDLRLPTVAGSFGISAAPGLSDVLVERAKLNDCIHKVQDGLEAITAGTIPPNPTELLGSSAMEQLLAELKTRYEYIILDTPPICTVTDAALLARYASGAILVVREGVAQQRLVGDALQKLEFAGAKILGFVYTDVADSKKHYSGYGYGYGDANAKKK